MEEITTYQDDRQRQLSYLSSLLEQNPSNFDLHFQYVALLKDLGLTDQLSDKCEKLAQQFPLPESLWATYIANELSLASEPEDYLLVADLYIQALTDYHSISLSISALQFFGSVSPKLIIDLLPEIEAIVVRQSLDVYNGHEIWLEYFSFLKIYASNSESSINLIEARGKISSLLSSYCLTFPYVNHTEFLKKYSLIMIDFEGDPVFSQFYDSSLGLLGHVKIFEEKIRFYTSQSDAESLQNALKILDEYLEFLVVDSGKSSSRLHYTKPSKMIYLKTSFSAFYHLIPHFCYSIEFWDLVLKKFLIILKSVPQQSLTERDRNHLLDWLRKFSIRHVQSNSTVYLWSMLIAIFAGNISDISSEVEIFTSKFEFFLSEHKRLMTLLNQLKDAKKLKKHKLEEKKNAESQSNSLEIDLILLSNSLIILIYRFCLANSDLSSMSLLQNLVEIIPQSNAILSTFLVCSLAKVTSRVNSTAAVELMLNFVKNFDSTTVVDGSKTKFKTELSSNSFLLLLINSGLFDASSSKFSHEICRRLGSEATGLRLLTDLSILIDSSDLMTFFNHFSSFVGVIFMCHENKSINFMQSIKFDSSEGTNKRLAPVKDQEPPLKKTRTHEENVERREKEVPMEEGVTDMVSTPASDDVALSRKDTSPESSGNKTVFVHGLGPTVTETILSNHFSCAGTIKSIRIPMTSKGAKGIAYIDFDSDSSVVQALMLNQSLVPELKKRIYVSESKVSKQSSKAIIFGENFPETANPSNVRTFLSSFLSEEQMTFIKDIRVRKSRYGSNVCYIDVKDHDAMNNVLSSFNDLSADQRLFEGLTVKLMVARGS
ncbi:hypothetical protein RCL1_003951 [Eukaryota sp. TZLM3-RCL]